jgi:hypothetical protein
MKAVEVISMTEYSDALKKAQKELAECEAAADRLEAQRAKLRQTVAVLQSMVGVKVEQDQSLTDAILMVIKGAQGYMRAADVVARLDQMGFQVQPRSVASILSRLTKNSQIIYAVGDDDSIGYAWKVDTTKAERQDTNKSLAAMSKKKRGQRG